MNQGLLPIMIDYSFIIPVYNEADNLEFLNNELREPDYFFLIQRHRTFGLDQGWVNMFVRHRVHYV